MIPKLGNSYIFKVFFFSLAFVINMDQHIFKIICRLWRYLLIDRSLTHLGLVWVSVGETPTRDLAQSLHLGIMKKTCVVGGAKLKQTST